MVKRAIGDDGKPTLKQIGYISTYAEDKLEDAEQRREFWQRARYRLGKLRLQPNERALIEQQLARRVPRPQQAATDESGLAGSPVARARQPPDAVSPTTAQPR